MRQKYEQRRRARRRGYDIASETLAREHRRGQADRRVYGSGIAEWRQHIAGDCDF